MLFANARKKIEIQVKRDDYSFRFSDSFDDASRGFENNKIRSLSFENISFVDDLNIPRNVSWPKLSYWQSYRYLDDQEATFYLLQMSNERTDRHYQIVIRVETSKMTMFKKGRVHQWIMKMDEDSLDDQYELFKQLKIFCKLYTKLMSVRVQPYMPGTKALDSVHKLLSQFGFLEASPLSNLKTRMIDLRPSVDEILSSFSGNGRARLKIKSKDLEKIEVKEISSYEAIPFLQNALNASFIRSIKKESPYNFSPLFLRAKKFVNEVILLGFYFKDVPAVPQAFVVGVAHDNIFEYSVGGSLNDSRLRQFPFNHILMWQLSMLAKEKGGELLDMGGITDGGENDPIAGITKFKRLFPGFEFSTGREMELSLRPQYIYLYSLFKFIKGFFN